MSPVTTSNSVRASVEGFAFEWIPGGACELMLVFEEEHWFAASWSSLGAVVVSAVVVLLSVIALIRVAGLRSLSKMSGFDFAVTVAIGSILGSTVASSTPVADGVVAVGSLLGLQWLIAQLRRRSIGSQIVDNRPLLLMRDGEFIEGALDASRVTRADIFAKLRQANVTRLSDARAVILETTGDISVLHGSHEIDDAVVQDVRRSEPGS